MYVPIVLQPLFEAFLDVTYF